MFKKPICQVCGKKPATALMPAINKPNHFCRECFDNYMGQKAIDDWKVEPVTDWEKDYDNLPYTGMTTKEFIRNLLAQQVKNFKKELIKQIDKKLKEYPIYPKDWEVGL
jgi:hypothetical protein